MIDNIEFFWREWREKEELIELEYFINNPKSKIITIKDKLKFNNELGKIKNKEYQKLEKKYNLDNVRLINIVDYN